MITLYTWATPNGRKVSVMLEEIGESYEVKTVNIAKNEQFDPGFLAISPNNKIPAIADHDGEEVRTIFETAAILIYLAEKSGQLLPERGVARDSALEWLVWSVAGLGPMLGQWNYFAKRAPEPVPAATERFTAEAVRLFKVLEGRLDEAGYLAGDYGIADISAFTWTKAVYGPLREMAADRLGPMPQIDRWLLEIESRPAVRRGMAIPQV